MKNRIFEFLGIIILIFGLLYLNMFTIMYNIKVKSVENGGLMLSIFGQDFCYEYTVEE
jgi:hypothetical protein